MNPSTHKIEMKAMYLRRYDDLIVGCGIYKGGEYELVGVVRHSETHEVLALYRPLYNATGLWVRPYAMFFEEIEVEGGRRPRFEFVG